MSSDDECASECDSDTEKLEYTAAAMQQDDPFVNKVCAIVCVLFLQPAHLISGEIDSQTVEGSGVASCKKRRDGERRKGGHHAQAGKAGRKDVGARHLRGLVDVT